MQGAGGAAPARSVAGAAASWCGVGEAPPIRDNQVVIDRVVAVVNGDVIMMSELQEAIVLSRRDGRSAPDSAELERAMLNRLVDHRLQVQEAKRDKIEVTDDEVRAGVDDFVKRNGGDREKFEAQLQTQGVTWEALRREMREQLLAQRVRSRRVVRRSTVTEAEVDQYLAQNRDKFEAGLKYHALHMAVTVEAPSSPAAWEQAKQEIEQHLGRAGGRCRLRRAGADPRQGRDRRRSRLAGPGRARCGLRAAAPGTREGAGDRPDPVGAAYHLFKLDDREELTAERLAEARQQARDLLVQKKAQERFDEWVEGLRRKALIAIRL